MSDWGREAVGGCREAGRIVSRMGRRPVSTFSLNRRLRGHVHEPITENPRATQRFG